MSLSFAKVSDIFVRRVDGVSYMEGQGLSLLGSHPHAYALSISDSA